MDDQAMMSIKVMRICFQLFLRTMKKAFGLRYLHCTPNIADSLASRSDTQNSVSLAVVALWIACTSKWKNCLSSLKGQYQNPKVDKLASVSCEGVCNNGLYSWSWYAGRAGTKKDLVLVSNFLFFIYLLWG